jgi:hypothetical protein
MLEVARAVLSNGITPTDGLFEKAHFGDLLCRFQFDSIGTSVIGGGTRRGIDGWCWLCSRVTDRLPHLKECGGHCDVAHAERGERVEDGADDNGECGCAAAFAVSVRGIP